jgi:hypothetical protein
MLTWWPNLKKCSTVEISLITFTLGLVLTSTQARASFAGRGPLGTVADSANATLSDHPSEPPSQVILRREITGRASTSFEPLLQSWQYRYGSLAVAPLLQLASANGAGKGLEDTDRYIALMGAAKLGGSGAAPLLTRFLKDSSWMIRSGALRALTALGNPATASAVLPLLHDPALVVRLEAVEAVRKLQPTGAAEALCAALEQSANYHGGKAQWVPQKALEALATLRAPSKFAAQLKPLLDHENDPELQKQTITTLESLTGRVLKKNGSLTERIQEWKTALNKG